MTLAQRAKATRRPNLGGVDVELLLAGLQLELDVLLLLKSVGRSFSGVVDRLRVCQENHQHKHNKWKERGRREGCTRSAVLVFLFLHQLLAPLHQGLHDGHQALQTQRSESGLLNRWTGLYTGRALGHRRQIIHHTVCGVSKV